MIWLKNYRYKKEDYKSLIEALKRPNRYQYALLLQENPGLNEVCKGRFRLFKLPEGVLILSRYSRIRIPGGYLELKDLRKSSIKLIPYILYMPEDRIRLQINRDYLRRLWKKINAISSSAYWYGSKRKFQKDYLKAVNEIVREANDLASTCFIYPESIRAFNKRLKKTVLRFLTNVLSIKTNKAKEIIKLYLTVLRH